MFDEYCDICREHGALVPATVKFCVQREDASPEEAQYVRSCEQHKSQAEMIAKIMQRNMAPAVLTCPALSAVRA